MSTQAPVSPLDSNFSAVVVHEGVVDTPGANWGSQWLGEAGSSEGDLSFDFKVNKELVKLSSVVWLFEESLKRGVVREGVTEIVWIDD